MNVKSATLQAAVRCLYESFDVGMMQRLARKLFTEYNLYERTGYPETVPIPPQSVAKQIIQDIIDSDKFVELVETLIAFDREGYMGKRYPISFLKELVKGVINDGFIWDPHTNLFMEDIRIRRTPTWSRLQEDQEYQISFLRIDIVGNSEIVKTNPTSSVNRAYTDFYKMVENRTTLRNGRIWSWEGDGGLMAFYFGHPILDAVLTGMSLLHDLFMYNLASNPLEEAIQVRIAAHTGLAHYSPLPAELRRNETIHDVIEMESKFTPRDSLTISSAIVPAVDRLIQDCFRYEKTNSPWKLMVYSPEMEES